MTIGSIRALASRGSEYAPLHLLCKRWRWINIGDRVLRGGWSVVGHARGAVPKRKRATAETVVAGSRLSATIQAFSSSVQRRRRPTPVMTSKRRKPSAFVLVVELVHRRIQLVL